LSELIEVLTKDGTYSLRSVFFQENFHSLLGAFEETKSKFTATSNLQRFKGKSLNVLDICFGLGYNSASLLDELIKQKSYLNLYALEIDKKPLEYSLRNESFLKLWAPKVKKIFESLRPRAIIEIVEILKDSYVEEIFKQMDTEDVVDVFERSTEDETEEILEILDKSTKLNINKRLAYPENSVGRQMSEEVAKISTGLKVKDALIELKALHNNVEDLIYVYSVDNEEKLTGVISFREIVFADENELIKNVMIQNPISVNPSSDQEEAAILIKQYELLALPVVDKSNKLIGQTTVNTALDVIQTEIAQDFSQSFGAGAEETIFTPIQRSIRLRLPWIAINMGLAFIVSLLISQFEETIASDILLAALMPVVALVGGNSGAQSLAIVIRLLLEMMFRMLGFLR